jgi:hypothetical protein
MNVIAKMAGNTNHGWFGLVVSAFFMAIPASKIGMPPIEDEACAGIVIELPQ